MLRNCLLFIIVFLGGNLLAQDPPEVVFGPPFDFPLTLSGNFGEIRANHFHGGLDFKTDGVSGKKVLALADGYISRVRVTHGSGYVLDVTYDTGYWTINRHLSGFVAPIAGRVEALQYEQESWEVEIVPEPGEYPVRKGEQIAWSGNTGYSFGPHLHLDMFESATDDYIDPLPFFMKRIRDTKPPRADAYMLWAYPGEGVVDGRQGPKSYPVDQKKNIEAWGKIAAGIKAFDYMDQTSNKYGVHTVILSVDGQEVFRSVVDRFSQYENRMINSWAYSGYMKSFKDPGNTLRMLHPANEERGWVTIDEERDYKFEYILKDRYGNTARYTFVVRGKKQPIPSLRYKDKHIFTWDRVNYLHDLGMSLIIPKGLLYDNVYLNYQLRGEADDVAFTYQLHDQTIYLHDYCDLSIGLRNMPVADSTKYYVARVYGKGRMSSVGGSYENGFMHARIRELGTYTVALDTIPPEVTAVEPGSWAKKGEIAFRVRERETGIASYRGTIDGEYAIFGLEIMTNKLICVPDPERVKKGEKHEVEITVTDRCGNVTVARETFTW